METSECFGDVSWFDAFPALRELDADAARRLLDGSAVVSLPAGERVFGAGTTPTGFVLVLEGVVRVQRLSECGREIVLYRIRGGESCTLTTACLLGDEPYGAEARVERDARAVVVPRPLFDALLAGAEPFRRLVFTAFGRRIAGLMQVIDEIAFSRLDIRLAQRLLELVDGAGTVTLTHRQLAAELGSAREVISRQLAEFQRHGWIVSGRGSIRLCEPAALERLARSH